MLFRMSICIYILSGLYLDGLSCRKVDGPVDLDKGRRRRRLSWLDAPKNEAQRSMTRLFHESLTYMIKV